MRVPYPLAQLDFEDWFSTEEKCQLYLFKIRWPKGFRCPQCDHTHSWNQSRQRYVCQSCRHQTTLTAGTMLQGTHLSLRLWFRAIWWIVNQKNGVSALGLQRGLGIGSYRTAWLLLHKIRSTMVAPGRHLLSGKVEIDEVWLAGKRRNLKGRNRIAGPVVLMAVEVIKDVGQLGRIRIKSVSSKSGLEISNFVRENILLGSHLFTDGSSTYQRFQNDGYQLTQTPTSLVEEGRKALPHVNLVVSLLKSWLQGTHHGRWSIKHLQAYLDEFVFRFNRRTSNSRGLLFFRILEAGLQMYSPTYTEMIDKGTNSEEKSA